MFTADCCLIIVLCGTISDIILAGRFVPRGTLRKSKKNKSYIKITFPNDGFSVKTPKNTSLGYFFCKVLYFL